MTLRKSENIQVFGGFLSAVAVWFLYQDMPKTDATAGIFATYPRENITMIQGRGLLIDFNGTKSYSYSLVTSD